MSHSTCHRLATQTYFLTACLKYMIKIWKNVGVHTACIRCVFVRVFRFGFEAKFKTSNKGTLVRAAGAHSATIRCLFFDFCSGWPFGACPNKIRKRAGPQTPRVGGTPPSPGAPFFDLISFLLAKCWKNPNPETLTTGDPLRTSLRASGAPFLDLFGVA